MRYARQGEARVPCLKLPSRAFLVARVPFSKNGGGDHLNQVISPDLACPHLAF